MHTEVSIGSRKSNDKKMAASREKSGSRLHATSVTGEITARKASESSSIRMATNTKACGSAIKDTARELTGRTRAANSVESTPATGMKTRNMAEVPSSTRVETGTMATGSTACRREKVA